jgi:lactate 2-monooxygenase
VPRMLTGSTGRDLRTEVAGTPLRAPLLLAPVGAGALVRRDSDVLIARGAAAAGVPYVFSNQGCSPMERTAKGPAAKPEITLGALRTLVSIAREHPGGFFANLTAREPRAAVETFLDIYSNPGLSWAHLATLRGRTRLPILLKGILHPDDARRALDAGVDGIVVSNHGGRQVDRSVAALDALVAIRAAVGAEPTLLFDSGIRTGADVLVALALGADACLLGRPHVYGLALGGADGVRQVIENVIAELDLTMGLAGVASLADLTPEVLAP